MIIKPLKKIITILSLLVAFGGMHTSFSAQIPLVLQSKVTHLLQRLDKTEQLVPGLATEARDLIERLQQFGAVTEIQRIQKRLDHLSPPQVSIIGKKRQEEEKKIMSERVPVIIPDSTNNATSSSRLYSLFKTQATNASQRIRRLMSSPSSLYLMPKAMAFTLIAYLLYNLRKTYTGEPYTNFEFLAPFLLPTGIMLFDVILRWPAEEKFENAIAQNNVAAVRQLIKDKLIDVNYAPSQLFRAVATGVAFSPARALHEASTGRALYKAIQRNNPEMVKLFLQNGAFVEQGDIDAIQVHPYDLPETRENKLKIRQLLQFQYSKQNLDVNLKKQQQTQTKLRKKYEPTEVAAADAIQAMYGPGGQAKDIAEIVKSYLTPGYVNIPEKAHVARPTPAPTLLEFVEKYAKEKEHKKEPAD